MQSSVFNIQSKKQNVIKVIFMALCFFVFQNAEAQYEIPEVPKFQTSVYDYYNLLSANEKTSLENKLIKYSDTTSTQIVVVTIPSTKGENINYLAANWGEKWGIGGSAAKDNGILILLARDDRRIAIANGDGIEYLLTDALSKRIIERDIIPYFKQNDYAGGLNRGADAIFEVLNGEYQGTRQSSGTNEFPFGLLVILFFFFIVFVIALSNKKGGGKGGNGGTRSNSGGLLEAIILSNMGRGSYRSGSGSSGGFGGFGGGSSGGGGFGGGFGGGGFSGGGASGGW